MHRFKFFLFSIISMSILFLGSSGCGEPESKPESKPAEKQPAKVQKKIPKFDYESAYNFIKTQVEFGP